MINYTHLERDQVYHNYCCNGFDWTIDYIFERETPDSDDSVWGCCNNPECPMVDKKFLAEHGVDHYRGVSSPSREDFQMWLDNPGECDG